jgi:hypothetical protein
VPAIINTVTFTYYLRSLVYTDLVALLPTREAAEISGMLSRMIGEASPIQSVLAILFGCALCLAIACRVVALKTYIEQVEA